MNKNYTEKEAKALIAPRLEEFLRKEKAYTAFWTRLKPSHTRVGLKYVTISGGFPWGYNKEGRYTRNYWSRLNKRLEKFKNEKAEQC